MRESIDAPAKLSELRLIEIVKRYHAWALAFAGVVACAVSAGFESSEYHLIFVPKLLSELGVALIVLGGVGVLLETTHWQRYYRAKITEALEGPDWQTFLLAKIVEVLEGPNWQNRLTAKLTEAAILDPRNYPPDTAARVALSALRVKLGLAIDGSAREVDSLIEEETKNLSAFDQGYKSEMDITLTYEVEEPGLFKVIDITEYSIRGDNGRTLKRMVYGADKGEIVTASKVMFDRWEEKDRISVFTEEDHERIQTSLKTCFTTKLEKEIDLPELTRVVIEVHYSVPQNSLFFWQSQEAVHGYTMNIHPPQGFSKRVIPFMRTTGSATKALANKNWAMPFHGVGWIIVPDTKPAIPAIGDHK